MTDDASAKPPLPPSRSSFAVNFSSVLVLLLCLVFLKDPLKGDLALLGFLSVSAMIVTLVCGETFFLKSYRRARVGFVRDAKRDWGRILTKLLALNATLLLAFALYLMLPFYRADMYQPFLQILNAAFVIALAIGNLYILLLDHRLGSPDDGLLHWGRFLTGRWKDADNRKMIDYGRSVLLRVYFIAPMAAYFFGSLDYLFMDPARYTVQSSGQYLEAPVIQMMGLWIYGYFFMATVDVCFAVIGYTMCFKALDSDVQSTEPTVFGWLVCLCCYTPLFEVVMIPLIFHQIFSNPEWYIWFAANPFILIVWGLLTIVSMGTEASATMTFGMRFSNLTYRGLISTGLFRNTKHPQYVSKMLNRFFVHVPIFSLAGGGGVALALLSFFGLALVYYFRARTEENHLSRYADYVEYAQAMNGRSVFRGVAKVLPFLRYDRDKALAGKLF